MPSRVFTALPGRGPGAGAGPRGRTGPLTQDEKEFCSVLVPQAADGSVDTACDCWARG